MSTLEDIEKALTELPPDQPAEFRAWFEAFDAARFDDRIERDSPNRRSPISALVARGSCEALRQSDFLGGL